MRVDITKSNLENKKINTVFYDLQSTKKLKTVHFGASGYSDYNVVFFQDPYKDPERKQRYIDRHQKNENWDDPMTAGTLALYIFWNKPTIKESIKNYKKKFNI